MILGVGSFAHSIGTALADAGADVSTYLTRNYGHFSALARRQNLFARRISQSGSADSRKQN